MAGQTWSHYVLVDNRGTPIAADIDGVHFAQGELVPWSKARKVSARTEGRVIAAAVEGSNEDDN